MRYYESLYIVNPNYEQQRLDEVIKAVAEKVSEFGMSVINHREWGKKRLAYPIQKNKYGSFMLLHFETKSAENLDQFERFMVLQKPILRNQTVILSAKPEIHIEETPAVAEETKEAAEETPVVAEETKEAAEETPVVAEETKEEEATETVSKEEESESTVETDLTEKEQE